MRHASSVVPTAAECRTGYKLCPEKSLRLQGVETNNLQPVDINCSAKLSPMMLFLGVHKDVDQKIPSSYICPLSLAILRDPVMDADDPQGRAVSRNAIEEFQRLFGFRPFTGKALNAGA